ncbi:hypothetical protein HCN44_008842 [Aphidius gifuensis]|uniref:Uncharacterized protein n=1 Tax=Aphidius gifuensis TaxID=684658 RepID=A0A835CVV8_APHGI|nr:hypothetical protein HCN44_008842 [Aphidius gifuensis]
MRDLSFVGPKISLSPIQQRSIQSADSSFVDNSIDPLSDSPMSRPNTSKSDCLFSTNINRNSTSTMSLSNKLPQPGPSAQKEKGLFFTNINQNSTSTLSLSNKLPQSGPSAQKENCFLSTTIDQDSNVAIGFLNDIPQPGTSIQKPPAVMLSRFNSKHMYMKSTEKEIPESEEDQVFESIQGFDW